LLLTQQSIAFIPFDIIDREIAVKAFFVISGGLIWTSASRTEYVLSYFKKRFFRVYPAYIFSLVFFSLISFLIYSSEVSEIFSYLFWNSLFLNFIQPCIGSMFENNLLCAVNGSLWTLKLEVGFYIFVGFCFYVFKRKSLAILIGFTFISVLLSLNFTILNPDAINQVYLNQLPFMFFYFGFGALLFSFYTELSVKNNNFIFFSIAILYFISDLFYPLFIISFVYYIAYGLPFKINLSKLGDLSYGTYIFHFPIIQIFISLNLFVGNKYLDISIIFLLVYIFSFFTWHFLEKPFIQFTHRIKT
jgi:peptidoglycan/LPS O-acetylase OafA/YrhL